MSRRFVDLSVRARRLITRGPTPAPARAGRTRLTARRQTGQALTQFSFRLALVIDLAYIGVGALGGAAIGRASAVPPSATAATVPPCPTATAPTHSDRTIMPNAAAARGTGALPAPANSGLTTLR